MLFISKTRLNSKLYLQDILNININKKYDVIISMFAVINHLKDTKEVKQCCNNVGLFVKSVYENYDVDRVGKATSKNLQFVISKI